MKLLPGQIVQKTASSGASYSFAAPIPSGATVVVGSSGETFLERSRALATLMTVHSVPCANANCMVSTSGVIITQVVPPRSPLVLGLCESSVLTQDMPKLLAACRDHVCPAFLTGRVPKDSCARVGHPAGIDGYISIVSMARVACYAQWCTHACVIGCGYGEMAALFMLTGRHTLTAFELFGERRNFARAVIRAVGFETPDQVQLYGDFCGYQSPWPLSPVLIWTNNYRFNDDPTSDIPRVLLSANHFPVDTSLVLTIVPFAGEVEVPVCVCGGCYEGFCDHRGLPGCFIVRPRDHVNIDRLRCGPCSGFARGDRVMLRTVATGVQIEPHAAGRGTHEAVAYQLFTCNELPPTPHAGIVYNKIALTGPDDVTDELLGSLDFVAHSDVVGGPLQEQSMIFHGVDGEQYGIDMALVFTAQEPGEDPFVYAYRTLGYVRGCGMSHVVRINHDVVKPRMQGRSFINQVNLLTAQVLRSHFSDATHIVIEPDREIGYHQNYITHGFLWRLQDNICASTVPPTAISLQSFRAYRGQIDIDPQRYASVWFELPDADRAAAATSKRPRLSEGAI